MPPGAWYKSLYWRIAIGFVCFLGVTLVIQAAFFVWIVVRGEREVSAGSLDVFARMVAADLETEIAANGTANIEQHVAEQFGSLPRPVWVLLRDGQVISGRWGALPPMLLSRALMRLRTGGNLFPPGTGERTGMFRLRRFAAARIVVGGRTVGAVIVQAGRPSEMVAREFGPMLLLIVTGLVIGMGGLAALVIFRPANRRLQSLAHTARRLGAGDTSARAPEAGGDEIAGVARAFNQMAKDLVERAEALQASDRARRQLLADVSHELMTPLTAIRGYLETLGMPSIALDDAARTRYLGIVHEESLRLERIIGDLLDLARLDAGGAALTMEDVSVGQIFARVLERHEQAAIAGAVSLVAGGDEGILIRGDRLRLEQALQNLAANALRHTPAGGRVLLEASRRGDAVVLSVIDNGAGISLEHLPHVFDRFYKADASRREAAGAGSGLGLSIVKAIVERHGGTITVRSEPGVETAFEIVLPA